MQTAEPTAEPTTEPTPPQQLVNCIECFATGKSHGSIRNAVDAWWEFKNGNVTGDWVEK